MRDWFVSAYNLDGDAIVARISQNRHDKAEWIILKNRTLSMILIQSNVMHCKSISNLADNELAPTVCT